MADTAYERFKKDQELSKTQKKEPGTINTVNEVQESFLKALEAIGEPKKPVKYLRPLNIFQKEDKSLARFILAASPELKIYVDKKLSEKHGKPIDSIKFSEDAEEKDYISILDEVRKGVDTGAYDLALGLKETLFTGSDYFFGTEFLEEFDKMMADPDKQPDRPETWRGDLVGLMTQFAIPGGIIQKVLRRTKTAGQIKSLINKIKGTNTRKISKIAARAIEGIAVVGATDFIASEPGRRSLFFEPESTKGLTGKERAAASFRNKIKYGYEGALVGGGFPIVGKSLQLGYKYGLAPFVKTSARLGFKGVDNAVFRPISYLGSRPLVEPVVAGSAKLVRNASNFVLTKALAPAIVSTFSGKVVRQLPPFEKWRLQSITSPIKEKRVIKKLDNILSYLRSFGKAPKDIEGVSEQVMLFIKGRARKIDRTMEALEKKAYQLAKGFESQHNKNLTSPALQKHYLNHVDEFLRNQRNLNDLPTELQPLAANVKLEIKNIMKEFQKALPKGKDGDKITKELENIEINKIQSYLVKSFSTFTNPNYVPDKKVFNNAVDWVVKNVIKKNKIDRNTALTRHAKMNSDEAKFKEYGKMIVESVLLTARAEGKNPLRQMKEISNILKLGKIKMIKTGDELPDVIQKLLGPEKNIKASVSFTTAEMISAMANKKAADFIAQSGLKNKWLYRTAEEARANGVLDPLQIMEIPKLGKHMRTDLTKLYTTPEYVNMFKGIGGDLDKLVAIPIYRQIMQGKVGIQIGKTLYSPQTQVRNVTSASFFALANGHIGGRASVVNSMKIVLDDIFKAGKKNIDEVEFNNYVERLVRLGVWDENVVASELKAIMNQLKAGTIQSSDALFDKLIKMAPTDKVARLYAGGDNVWKQYGFEYSRSQLIQALRNLDDIKAWHKDMGTEFVPINSITGQIKTFDDALDEAAAFLIRNTYPTYSKVPPAIQNLRKLPLGAFISFPAEILRTGTNIMAIALKEASSKNPAIRQMGLRRMTGAFMTYYAGGTGLVQLAQFLTNSTDAQWSAYKRSSAASWDANSNLIPIKAWENGESAAINFSYFSPYDSLWAPMEAAINQANKQKLNPQETDDYVMSVMFAENGPVMTFLEPFITEPIGYDRFIDVTVRNGRKEGGGTVFSASDSIGDKFAKSFAYILDGVQPGVTKSADKIVGAIEKDLTKGGKPLKLLDELLALFAGTRIIRIDAKKDLRYFASDMNRMLRAVDENENFYNVDNYQNNTPNDMVKTFRKMQEEAFRIQKDMFIRIQDLKLLDLDEDDIVDILIKSGVNKKLAKTIADGEFTPVNFSKKRFETKINTIEKELEKQTGKFNYRLNEDFVFPEDELEDVMDEYEDKEFFKETYNSKTGEYEGGYYPDRVDYKLDKKGFVLKYPEGHPEEGNPIPDEGFVKKGLKKISPIIRKGFNKLLNPLSDDFKVQTPPLPVTSQPKVQMASIKSPVTGLTRTESALLSPSEQVIARRT
jgi:hypothetical protein